MIKVRQVSNKDNTDIFLWRNDKTTRKMSHSSDLVDRKLHDNWFSSSLLDKSKLLLLCENDRTHEKIGIVHFKLESTQATVSINLNPKMRGKAFAAKCLLAAIQYLKKKFPQCQRIDAEIKKVNIASEIAFKRAGFNLSRADNDLLFYQFVFS